MKNLLLKSWRLNAALLFALLIISCGGESPKMDAVEKDDSIKQERTSIADSSISILWEYDVYADRMIQHQIPQNISVETVIAQLNNRYSDEIRFEFIMTSADTVFVGIPDARYLTQRMGTTGAFSLMAEATYSLTEVSGIKFVNFEFEEGDHASPGLYQRADFF